MKTISSIAIALGLLATQASAETLKIGVVAPQTGPGAAWGFALDAGARIAADEANEKGGLTVDGKTYQIEVITYDDQYKAAETVTAVNRLIHQDGVRFIVGPLGAASLLAVKPITEPAEVLMMSNTYTVKALEDSEYIFRVLPTSREFVPPFVAWLRENRPELKKVGLLAPNDETGWDSQAVQREAYEANGFEVAAAELFERKQNDFRAILTKLLAAEPDTIELDTTPPPLAGLIIRQARELGFTGQFTKFGGVNVTEIVEAAGAENAEGLLGYLGADPASKEWEWLETQYGKFHPNRMGDFTFFFYDASKILFAGIEKAGTVEDTTRVRDAIEQASPFETLIGESHWGGADVYGIDHQLFTPTFLVEIAEGKGRVIQKLDAN